MKSYPNLSFAIVLTLSIVFLGLIIPNMAHVEGTLVDEEDEPVVEEVPCPEGELPDDNGECEMIQKEEDEPVVEEVPCPEGELPDDNGECETIQKEEDEPVVEEVPCPEGELPDDNGECRKYIVNADNSTELISDSKTDCSNYSNEPKPSLEITHVAEKNLVGQEGRFIESEPIMISYTFQNNADRPISGVIAGGTEPVILHNIKKGQVVSGTIEAAGPYAGRNTNIAMLAYYDKCTPQGYEITPPTITAEKIGDVYSKYYITLNKFYIDEARSNSGFGQTDTDWVTIAGKSDYDGETKSESKLAGDFSDKAEVPVNLKLGPFYVADKLSFNYLIMNKHGDSNYRDINIGLKQSAEECVNTVAGGGLVSGGKCIWGALQGLLPGILKIGGCDGPVAQDEFSFSIYDLYSMTKDNGSYSETWKYTGESQIGCGADYRYEVQWTISKE